MLQKSFFEMGARMGDDSSQIVRALISNVEYRFVEKLSSATDGSEVVLCEAPDGERRYATCEAWEAGYARFEARQSADDGIVTSASSSAEKLALFNLLFVMRGDVYAKSYFNKKKTGVSVIRLRALTSGIAVWGKAPSQVRRLSASRVLAA